jgi:hypothetical protein
VLVWNDSGTTRPAAHDPNELASAYALGESRQITSRLATLIETLFSDIADSTRRA